MFDTTSRVRKLPTYARPVPLNAQDLAAVRGSARGPDGHGLPWWRGGWPGRLQLLGRFHHKHAQLYGHLTSLSIRLSNQRTLRCTSANVCAVPVQTGELALDQRPQFRRPQVRLLAVADMLLCAGGNTKSIGLVGRSSGCGVVRLGVDTATCLIAGTRVAPAQSFAYSLPREISCA